MYGYYFFFFKQKTAYEMRISDWSSDVCSSDLYFRFVAEETRQWMAQLGIRTIAELIGRTDLLGIDTAATDKARGLDLSPILESAGMVLPSAQYCMFNNEPFDKRSEEHTSDLQSLMRHSHAVSCLKKSTPKTNNQHIRLQTRQ